MVITAVKPVAVAVGAPKVGVRAEPKASPVTSAVVGVKYGQKRGLLIPISPTLISAVTW